MQFLDDMRYNWIMDNKQATKTVTVSSIRTGDVVSKWAGMERIRLRVTVVHQARANGYVIFEYEQLAGPKMSKENLRWSGHKLATFDIEVN